MTPRATRLLRGTLLGGVAVLLAALSHTWAGGVAPDALALVVGGVFAAAVGTIAVGRRRASTLRTAVAVAIGQLAFHLGFSLLGGGAAVTQHPGHHASVAAIVADPTGAVTRGGVAMWLAHAAAGALTVLYLHHLERRTWALLARLGRRLVAPLGEAPALAAPRIRITLSPAPAAPAAPLRGGTGLRGPPLGALA